MTNNYDIFIIYKRKGVPTANCWSGSNVVLFKSCYGVPLILLLLSYGALSGIRSAFEEGPKIMRGYTLFTNIGSSTHEACLLALRTYVLEAMNPMLLF